MPNIADTDLNYTTQKYLKVLGKLSGIVEFIAILIISIPLFFINDFSLVFGILIAIIICFAIGFFRYSHYIEDNVYHKIAMLFSLGMTAGVLQLDPVPIVCLGLIGIFALLHLPIVFQLFLSMVFFLSAIVFYFITKNFFSVSPVINILVVNVTAVIAIFFTLASHYFVLTYRYRVFSQDFDKSKKRFEHFMNMANKLARYAPSQIWQAVVQSEKDVVIENRRRKMTVFFSDIKGFTDLSETMNADDLALFLNDYFDSMSNIAKRHGGTIDKFIGDALMIFFGDPDSKGEREDALACVEMALDMRRELERLRAYWLSMGFSGLHVRMGINTGYCHVGNFGSATRLTYTALGKEVNLAARIQSAAKPDHILISKSTYGLIKHNYICIESSPIMLKGISDHVDVWYVDRIRQGEELDKTRWVENNLPGFNLHMNMLNIKGADKAKIRQMLHEARILVDESIHIADDE